VNDYDDAIRLFVARGEMRGNPNDWVVNSGATEHMNSSQESFVSYRPLTIHKKVCLGNGTIIYAPGIGNVGLEFNLGNTTQQGLVQNVYYIPELHGNLFSLSNLTKRHYKIVFNENACRIYNPVGTLTAVAHLHGNMFILDARTSAPTIRVATLLHDDEQMTSLDAPALAYAARTKTSTASLSVWHRWLGHANLESVKRLERKEMVSGMGINNLSIDSTMSPCPSCLHGKQTRAPMMMMMMMKFSSLT
jgi:hypothetical protein